MTSLPSRWFTLAEAAIGAGIAVVIEVVNVTVFGNTPAGIALGVGSLVAGLMLSVQRNALERTIEHETAPIHKIKEYLDISREVSYEPLSSIVQRYGSITEPEFLTVKNRIATETQDQLKRLAVDKRSPTLQTGEYYEWLFEQFKKVGKGSYVHAVSMSTIEEWNESDLEANFLKANIEAGQRGAEITRIFVVGSNEIANFLAIDAIQKHAVESTEPLHGHWVRREVLQKQDPRLLGALGEGFIDFNGRVGLEDRFGEPGEARGDVTMLPADLQRMRLQYDRLMQMAVPLSSGLQSQ